MSSYIAHSRHDIPIIHEAQFDNLVQHQQQQQHQQQHHHNLPLRQYNNAQYLQAPPPEADIARLSHSPISTIESSPATSTLDFDSSSGSDYYMQRVSTQQQGSRHPSPLETIGLQQTFVGHPRSAIGPQRTRHSIAETFHKRTSSDSTIHLGSFIPTSFPQQSFHQPYIVDTETQQYSPHQELFDHTHSLTSTPKSYPQASQPIDHSAFYAPDYSATWHSNAQNQYDLLRHQTLYQQQQQQQQQQQVAQYQGQFYHNMTDSGEVNGMQGKMQPAPLAQIRGIGPRTISAICEDELYNPEESTMPVRIPTTTPRIKSETNTSSPTNAVFAQALHTARQSHLEAARSASPTTSTFSQRDKSPYRPSSTVPGSPFEAPNSPARMETVASLRERQKLDAAANAIASATRRTSREPSQTVSPKEVLNEYEPQAESENQQTMFRSLASPPRQNQHKGRPSRLNQELTRSSTYENMFVAESSAVSNDSATSAGSQTAQIPQQYPFISKQRSTGIPESSQESNPRFPATLISMESTRSERSDPRSRSRSSAGNSPEVEPKDEDYSEGDLETEDSEAQRPDNTRSDIGTYSCTYHGCSQRFETPQKLQRHKKEGHRQGTPSSNPQTRMTQAGLHKCTRINPQTGKPCNSEFSRPYDLTRHEDTIHNAKKQKVRCPVCVEEKTFSRNDALTRHMRVVHPDTPFDAKPKKGGRGFA